VIEYYDRIAIAFIHTLQQYGTVEKLGAFASVVKYRQGEEDIEELMDNEDFVIVDEIVFEHVEEDN
jgi:hypothetical protein